jgi:hypothetical protein
VDVAQPTLFLADFLPQAESLRERARLNPPTTINQDEDTPIVVPIEQQSSDFFVFISPEAQLLQQAADFQDEQQNAFGQPLNIESPAANEFVSINTSIGRSRRLGGLTSSEAIAIYRLIDTFR